MTDAGRLDNMYRKANTLTTRIGLHEKYSVNPYGFGNWVFDQYVFDENIKVLELGCGTGGVWQNREGRLPQKAEIILSDFSALMVQKTGELLHGLKNFSFLQIDVQDIPFGDAAFDVVIANHMLYHVPDLDRALSEIRRVLKANGRFYATTIGEQSLQELNDIYRQLEGKATFANAKNLSFTLENGQAVLGKYFGNIELRQYEDALAVTDAEDLMAYIISYNDVPEAAMGELRSLVDAGFTDGVFRIRKEQGMFVCGE